MSPTIIDRVNRILQEDPIGLSAAARLFGSFRAGRPTSPSTVFRWCIQGTKLPDGTRVHLEHIRLSSRIMTSRAARVRFLAAQQTDSDSVEPPVKRTPRSETARSKASAAAGKRLEQMGA